jgi:hypothetical protein
MQDDLKQISDNISLVENNIKLYEKDFVTLEIKNYKDNLQNLFDQFTDIIAFEKFVEKSLKDICDVSIEAAPSGDSTSYVLYPFEVILQKKYKSKKTKQKTQFLSMLLESAGHMIIKYSKTDDTKTEVEKLNTIKDNAAKLFALTNKITRTIHTCDFTK